MWKGDNWFNTRDIVLAQIEHEYSYLSLTQKSGIGRFSSLRYILFLVIKQNQMLPNRIKPIELNLSM